MRICTRRHAGLLAAPLFAMSIGFLLGAGCGKPGSGSAGPAVSGGGGATSSSSTVQSVSKNIQADPQLAAAGITVTEDRGSISLKGTVASMDLKDRAEKIVYDTQKQMKQQPGVWDYLMIAEAGARPGFGAATSSR
jgi:hypothetical protein